MIKLKNMLNEKKEFTGNLEMIASMNKKKHDSTIARIEVADNLTEENTKKIYRLSMGPSEFTNNEENSLISLNKILYVMVASEARAWRIANIPL